MNTQLLHEIADLIEQEPDKHDQSSWLVTNDEGDTSFGRFHYMLNELDQIQGCATKGCVAGWAVVKSSKEAVDEIIDEYGVDTFAAAARLLLDIDIKTAAVLFDQDYEPVVGFPAALRELADFGILPEVDYWFAEEKFDTKYLNSMFGEE